MFYFRNPEILPARLRSEVPAHINAPRKSRWADVNAGGKALGTFLEGPCFDPEGNFYCVDVVHGRILRLTPDGVWSVEAEFDGWPNGLKWIAPGRLLAADHRLGLIEITAGGNVEVLLEGYRGERFRGLNDLTFGPGGTIFFTDQGQSGLQEANGYVYRWHRASGRLDRIIGGVPSPNGLVFNKEGTRLFVAATRANAIWRLPFLPDGGVSKVGIFINLSGGGGPDGLAIDDDGGLVVAQPGLGILRFDAEGLLTHAAEISHGTLVTNIAFGGDENRDLYVTESLSGRIFTVRMPFPGHLRPGAVPEND